VNVADIKMRAKRSFGDEASVQLFDADIIRWINDAMKEIAQQNDLLETLATTVLVVGTAEYTFPTDMLTLRAIRVGNKKLEFLTLQQADEFITNYENPTGYQTGQPTHFWVWANKFTLYPTPDSSSATDIKTYYTRMPVDVANDVDIPELATIYHARIVEYVLQQAYEMDEDWQASSTKAAQFNNGLNNLKDSDWNERNAYPTITVLEDDL
jgi:hypothetical protein